MVQAREHQREEGVELHLYMGKAVEAEGGEREEEPGEERRGVTPGEWIHEKIHSERRGKHREERDRVVRQHEVVRRRQEQERQ